MLNGGIRRPNGGVSAFVYALLVHVLVIAVLVVSVRWHTQPKRVYPKVMQATVVQDAGAKKQIEQLRQQSDKLQALEAEKEKQAQREKLADQEKREKQARQQADTEKKKRIELEQQKDAELKRKATDRKKLEDKKSAEAEKKRAAAEQQKKDAEQRHKQAESGLKEQLAAEEKERAQAQAAALAVRQQGEIARFEAIIRQKVERSWTRPASTREGLECTVQVRLVPGGEVLQVTVMRSSGNALFDRSAVNAIYKASPLPVPDDKSMFDHFREFEFKFRPEG